MINSNQLRLGNRIKYADHKVWRKSVIGTEAVVDLDIFKEACQHPDRFDPIPLTTERLLTYGFMGFVTNSEMTLEVSNNSESESMNITCPDKKANEIRLFLEISQRNENWENNYVSILLRASYLHQLQNLYFDLTGEELTIKPPLSAQQA